MMRRRSRGFRRRARRTVSWLSGVSTYDASVSGNTTRTITLTQAGLAPPLAWGATIGLVVNSDLPAHGGEDVVLTRIRGRLGFMGGRRDAGAGFANTGFQCRVAVVQVSGIAGTATILGDDLLSSAGLGKDNILWMADVVVPGIPVGATGGGYDLAVGGLEGVWLDVDVRARRKVYEDMPVILWFQTCFAAGTAAADFQLLGGLRTLLMRPR